MPQFQGHKKIFYFVRKLTLAMSYVTPTSAKCHALEILDDVVFAYFAVEMVIKMIAMGVWGKLGYLGDSWNRLGTEFCK